MEPRSAGRARPRTAGPRTAFARTQRRAAAQPQEQEEGTMKITLTTYGTRGDVQPVLSLAFGLQQRGHTVRLVGSTNAEAWTRAAGVPFAPLPVDVQELFAKPAAQQMLARGDMRSFFKWLAVEEAAYKLPMHD